MLKDVAKKAISNWSWLLFALTLSLLILGILFGFPAEGPR
jgi:hypothetical protein